MNTGYNRFIKAPIFLVLAMLMLPGLAQAQEVIGRIIRTTGNVNGVNDAGEVIPLGRGSNVYINLTITTEVGGSVQIRLSDGAMVTLN